MYVDLVEAADWDADDPRLPAVADRLVSMFEEDAKRYRMSFEDASRSGPIGSPGEAA